MTSTLEPPPGGQLMTGQASITGGTMLCRRDAVPPALPPSPIVGMPRSDAGYRVGLLQTPVGLGGRRGSHGCGLVTTWPYRYRRWSRWAWDRRRAGICGFVLVICVCMSRYGHVWELLDSMGFIFCQVLKLFHPLSQAHVSYAQQSRRQSRLASASFPRLAAMRL